MKRKYRRLLDVQANAHNVRLTDAEGVVDERTCHIAMLAICVASAELNYTDDNWAMTGDSDGEVVVCVKRVD